MSGVISLTGSAAGGPAGSGPALVLPPPGAASPCRGRCCMTAICRYTMCLMD